MSQRQFISYVDQFVIHPGEIRGRMEAQLTRPYDIVLYYEQWNEAQWDKVLTILASKASYTAALLNGTLHQDLEEKFSKEGLSLAVQYDVARGSCSCSVSSSSNHSMAECSHIRHVHDTLIQVLVEKPLLLFKLKGMDEQQLLRQLRMMRSKKSDVPPAVESIALDGYKDHSVTNQPAAKLLADDNDPDFWPKEMALHMLLQPVYAKVSDRANAIITKNKEIL